MAEDKKKEAKRKSLEELFNEPCTVKLDHALMHQSFEIYGGGQQSTLSNRRPGMQDMEIVFHPGYGLIGRFNGKYFISPSANVVVGYEDEPKGRR